MNVFFDAFKGSQSLAKMSKVTSVSYLHSSVNDSAVHITAVSMTPLCSVHAKAEKMTVKSQRCQ
jgi:hypothetical protein